MNIVLLLRRHLASHWQESIGAVDAGGSEEDIPVSFITACGPLNTAQRIRKLGELERSFVIDMALLVPQLYRAI